MFTDSDTLVPMSSNMIGNIYFDEKNKTTSEWTLMLDYKGKYIAGLDANIHIFENTTGEHVASLRIKMFESTHNSGNLFIKANTSNNDKCYDRFHNGMLIEWKLVKDYIIHIYI